LTGERFIYDSKPNMLSRSFLVRGHNRDQIMRFSVAVGGFFSPVLANTRGQNLKLLGSVESAE
jgi:hypothetical protein